MPASPAAPTGALLPGDFCPSCCHLSGSRHFRCVIDAPRSRAQRGKQPAACCATCCSVVSCCSLPACPGCFREDRFHEGALAPHYCNVRACSGHVSGCHARTLDVVDRRCAVSSGGSLGWAAGAPGLDLPGASGADLGSGQAQPCTTPQVGWGLPYVVPLAHYVPALRPSRSCQTLLRCRAPTTSLHIPALL
jgi:hypothetical protein